MLHNYICLARITILAGDTPRTLVLGSVDGSMIKPIKGVEKEDKNKLDLKEEWK